MSAHTHIYSRYLATTWGNGVEYITCGCRTCEATIRFAADAKLAQRHNAICDDYATGMSATALAEKYGYESRGMVVNLLNQLGVEMRSHSEAKRLTDAAKAAA